MNLALRFIIRLTIFGLICLLVGESFLRFVLQVSKPPVFAQNPVDRIVRFEKTVGKDEGIFTFGRWAEHRAHWRINNDGWNSLIDYRNKAEKRKPRVAIIGDSYIEGMHVNVEDHCRTRLEQLLGGSYDIYVFGETGAEIPQYLNMARYANAKYDPDVYFFYVEHSDLEEGLRKIMRKPSILQFDIVSDQIKEIPPDIYHSSYVKKMSMELSAIALYIYSNNFFLVFTPKMKTGIQQPDGTPVNVVKSDLELEAKYFFKRLNEEFPNAKKVILLDADRYAISKRKSPIIFETERIFTALPRTDDIDVIDLIPYYADAFVRSDELVNYKDNHHLNAHGHDIVAKAMKDEIDKINSDRNTSIREPVKSIN